MKIEIVVVGKTKESWIREGEAEYLKRLRRFAQVEVKTVADEREWSDRPVEVTQKKEGLRILKALPSEGWIVGLDREGRSCSSEGFAALLEAWSREGKKVVFLVGGACGFSSEVVGKMDQKLSLSSMTFTHQMIRPFLLEQIYRGFSINAGTPYHK